MKHNTTKFIKELQYAIKLHKADFKYRIKEYNQVLHEKEFVINLLRGDKLKLKDFEKIKRIIKNWKYSHEFWTTAVKANKKLAKQGGSIKWHYRWIKLYNEILGYLQKKTA